MRIPVACSEEDPWDLWDPCETSLSESHCFAHISHGILWIIKDKCLILHTDLTDLTDFTPSEFFPLRDQMRIPVACSEEDPWDLWDPCETSLSESHCFAHISHGILWIIKDKCLILHTDLTDLTDFPFRWM